MQLILVRHGETPWNKEGRIQGTSDIELSDTGIEQARKLALSLKDSKIEAIHASPLKRAYRTAEIINSFHGRNIEVHPELMEMDQGDFEGLSFQELLACEKEFIHRWIADPASVKMPRGESLAELQDRVWPTVEKIIAGERNALVVAHNFIIAAILCRIRDISLSEFRSTCVDTASRTVIRFRDGRANIEVMNDRSHLTVPGL
ncbi:MAG: Phosphoserine phosphatase 1 [Deltaproteobacteria bacterium ADurb.Bin151]|jgi:broad specificity phosphatase PhoE|nr:histidine phosphatase family protein [Smithella sp.]OQB55366.1 MAG: Phosphoserine phosphatase 1 [Deltaproteobacteria bacterium ADurb.Bin151]HNZ11272.1 histidine phosphatase family protein [Smithellaceae bacterium]HOG82176.1 histidine phosphatase family protein [Smithellaceae bacterium]HOQ42010.1 histidine phosphatase family protein [Smithellaceae bacterium]